MSDPHPDTLIEAYFAGELDTSAAERVRAYLEATPGRRGFMAGVWAAIRGEDIASLPRDIELSIRRLWERIHGSHAEVSRSAVVGRVIPLRSQAGGTSGWSMASRVWSAASVGVAAALVAVTMLVVLPHRRSAVPDTMMTYVTPRGERARIVLPDGTHITLNVASRIDVPRSFGERNRVVHLSGEAYFAVAHAAGAPFVVTAAGTRTTVLGTGFGVRAYRPTDVQVAVQSGKVAVNHVVLGAQDIAHVSAAGGVSVAHHQPLEAALAFTAGRLVVANRPLREAIPELDRWYDVDIRLGEPSLGDVRFDAVLVSGSIGDVMEVLGNTLDVRIVRNGRTLTLYPR